MPIFPKNKFIQKVTKGSCRLVLEPTLDNKKNQSFPSYPFSPRCRYNFCPKLEDRYFKFKMQQNLAGVTNLLSRNLLIEQVNI